RDIDHSFKKVKRAASAHHKKDSSTFRGLLNAHVGHIHAPCTRILSRTLDTSLTPTEACPEHLLLPPRTHLAGTLRAFSATDTARQGAGLVSDFRTGIQDLTSRRSATPRPASAPVSRFWARKSLSLSLSCSCTKSRTRFTCLDTRNSKHVPRY